ncbi:hypothetical protein QOZ80_4BG0338000 [Eleusine coracana subsp. coracana]|nr:hypothetical protein QOZ80_4BG0338000 [Eleusine coracana subsp. coracana]
MGLLSSLPPHRRGALSGGYQWSFLDVVWAVFIVAVVVFLALVFTPRRVDPITGASSVRAGSAVPPCAASEVDLLPCEDPRRSSRLSREMNYYRERHCPARGEAPACLVPPPQGYRVPVPWPESLHKIWHDNMPYGKIAERKGHQGWMKHEGSYFIFPGGGTMFPDGAEQYIEKLSQYVPLKNGVLRTGLDMGCGVASFGGFFLKENIMTLSFAPRDSHKSQIQFALERGIPAFLLMLGTRRLPFPAQSFDFIHCSRCLIPFTAYNGSYLIEVDRLLRPGGFLIISGPPVRWKKQEKEWGELQAMTQALCYKSITVDGNTAIWKKPEAWGLIGVYHDWCEPFSTYPRTYDLIHADGINSLIIDPVSGNSRCDLFDVMLEMDRILRPEGTAIIRGSLEVIGKASQVAQSIRWNVKVHDSEPESGDSEKILVATKTFWKLPLTSQ